jgi:hypothetical protein
MCPEELLVYGSVLKSLIILATKKKVDDWNLTNIK